MTNSSRQVLPYYISRTGGGGGSYGHDGYYSDRGDKVDMNRYAAYRFSPLREGRWCQLFL